MLIECPKCGKRGSVNLSKAPEAGYQLKCPGCGTLFAPAVMTDGAIPEQKVATVPQSVAPGTVMKSMPAFPQSQPLQQPPAQPVRPASPVPGAAPASATRPAAAVPPARLPPLADSAKPARPAAVHPPVQRPQKADLKRCINHPQLVSDLVCGRCLKGFCKACCRAVQTAFLCPLCGGFCFSAQEHEKKEALRRQRSRPLRDELRTIIGYPVQDKVQFIVLAIFIGLFSVLGSFVFAFGAATFSQGLLLACAFAALSRVSMGNLKGYMPDVSDISDLTRPLTLGTGVLLISALPLIGLHFAFPDAKVIDIGNDQPAAVEEEQQEANTQQQPESPLSGLGLTDPAMQPPAAAPDEDPYMDQEYGETPLYVKVLMALAFLWYLGYAPAALTVAGVTRQFWQTVNPKVGIFTIQKMGRVYWEAMGIYVLFTLGQLLIGLPLGLIPIAGTLMKAVINCYVTLVVGCTLGFAVMKKAPELGLE